MFNHYLRNCNFKKTPLSSQTGYLHMDDILIRNCLVANGKNGILALQTQLTSISICFYQQKNATYHFPIFSTFDFLNQLFIGHWGWDTKKTISFENDNEIVGQHYLLWKDCYSSENSFWKETLTLVILKSKQFLLSKSKTV